MSGRTETPEHSPSPLHLAYLAGVAFGCLTGFSFYANKVALLYAEPLPILAWRMLLAFLAAFLWAAIKKGRQIREESAVKNRPVLFLLGVVFSFFLGTQLLGLASCTSVVAAILNTLVPVIVALMALVLLKERLSAFQWAMMLLGTAAVFYMVWRGHGTMGYSFWGLILLIASTIGISLYNLLIRASARKVLPFDVVFYTALVGTLVFGTALVVVALRSGRPEILWQPLKEPALLFACAFLGVGCIVFTNGLISYAMRYLSAAKGALFSDLATVISIAAGALLLSEPFFLYHGICSVIVIVTITLMNIERHGEEAGEEGEGRSLR